MNIDSEIQEQEIVLTKLKLKKQYGELGKMKIETEDELVALLQQHKVFYPQRVYVVNNVGAKDYTCLKEGGELCIGGFRHNDRHREPFYLKVDKNGNIDYEENINAELKAIKF